MKKLLIITSFTLTALSFLTSFTNSEKISQEKNCQYVQCIKIKKDGYQCRNCAQQGSYYCWSHR